MQFLSLIFFLAVGFIILIKGAQYLVDGASSLARKLSVSEIAIGLTVISFGTSAPELSINVLAALAKDDEIIFGNIIGSNLMNILLVLGVASAIYPLTVKKNTIWKEIPFSILAIFIFMILANDKIINSIPENTLSRSDGIMLLMFFMLFLLYVFKMPRDNNDIKPTIHVRSPLKTAVFIIGGMIGLTVGGMLVEKNAIKLAVLLGISHKMIGLTLVAGGTSLPELVTSVVAAFRKQMDMALGNVIGSNIFNLFFILGVSAFISPLEYDSVLNIDTGILAVCSVFLFSILWLRKKNKVERWMGILFIMIYVSYFYYLIIRK